MSLSKMGSCFFFILFLSTSQFDQSPNCVLYIWCVCVRICWTHYIKLLLNREHMQYAQEHSQRYLCHASPLSIHGMHCHDWHRRANVVERTSKGLTQLIGICGEMLLVHFHSHKWGKKSSHNTNTFVQHNCIKRYESGSKLSENLMLQIVSKKWTYTQNGILSTAAGLNFIKRCHPTEQNDKSKLKC